MKFIYDDGGRAAAGFKGSTGDCVARALAIAMQLPYAEVYAAMADINAKERKTKRAAKSAGKRTARSGIYTKRKGFRDYMARHGWVWTPTMTIGSGCKVHLHDGELPMGRLIVSVSKHYTAVINGVIHDTHDPQRDAHWIALDVGQPEPPGMLWRGNGKVASIQRRCVYGYWSK